MPILSRGALRAVLLLENRLIRAAFTTGRLNAVNLIAAQLAVSLDNAQLYAGYRRIADEYRRIAGEQAALRRVATLVARPAPPQEVFTAVAEEVGRLLAADLAILVRYDPPGTLEITGTWTSTGAPAPAPVGGRLPVGGRNVTTLVHQTGRPGSTTTTPSRARSARSPPTGGSAPRWACRSVSRAGCGAPWRSRSPTRNTCRATPRRG